jgi:hypothetical protein
LLVVFGRLMVVVFSFIIVPASALQLFSLPWVLLACV